MTNSSSGNSQKLDLLKKSLKKIVLLKKKLRTENQPIAIIGMSCRFPGGANSLEQFWSLMQSGQDGIIEVPSDRWDIEDYRSSDLEQSEMVAIKKGGFFLNIEIAKFDAEYFNISPREAENMDPQHRLLLEVTVEALESGNIVPDSLSGSLTGVYVGIYSHDYWDLIVGSKKLELIGHHTITSGTSSIASGRLSFSFNLKGPNFSVDTACSSSLVALNSAVQDLQLSNTNLAIVAGVNIMISPILSLMASRANMLSSDGYCKTFDASADGTARGEGCGVVVLKRLDEALKDKDQIFAVIKGCGINQDGRTNGITAPNAIAQRDLIEHVCQKAEVSPASVDYIETHGTATPLGDPIEVKAIHDTYGQRSADHPLMLGSVKTNIGHCESAAGMAGLIKAALALYHEEIPKNLHFKKLNPEIDLSFPAKILVENATWKRGDRVRRAAVSSFGYSGSNSHLILEETPTLTDQEQGTSILPCYIVTLSAKSEQALNSYVKIYIEYTKNTELLLGDMAYTSNLCRQHEQYRIAVVAKDIHELNKKLISGNFYQGEARDDQKKIMLENEPNSDWSKLLQEVAQHYINGCVIDWIKLYKPYFFRKISIPTYPFQRKNYWSKSIKSAQQLQGDIGFLKMFYQANWETINIQDSQQRLSANLCLLFSDDDEMSEVLSSKIAHVIKVKPGEEYCKLNETAYQANRLDLEGFKKICQDLPKDEIVDVIYFNSFDSSCAGLLHLAQALISADLMTRLTVITQQAQSIEQAALVGLGKTISLEQPYWQTKMIDLDITNDSQKTVDLLLEVIGCEVNDPIISLRNQSCYVPRLVQAQMEKKQTLNISPDGSYLITGGLGGMGSVFAQFLVDQGAKHIILNARHPAKQEIEKIHKEWRNQGVHCDVILGDISDANSFKQLFSSILNNYPPLKGIIHAAGVVIMGLLSEQTWKQFRQVLAPKFTGTQNLSDAIIEHNINLDFFVLFSSVGGAFGAPGVGAYPAANCCLDAFAVNLRSKNIPVSSISWGPWSNVGMAADETDKHRRTGYGMIKPDQGINAMVAVIESNATLMTVVPVQWDKYLQQLPFRSNFFENFSIETTKAPTGDLLDQLINLSPHERQKMLRQQITQVILEVLQLEQDFAIPADKGLFELGMDSTMVMEFRNKLINCLGGVVSISPTVAFDFPTLEKLAAHIESLLPITEPKQVEQVVKQPIKTTEPIAIIGMSCCFPGGANSVDEFWSLLLSGVDFISEVPANRWDISKYYDSNKKADNKLISPYGGFLKKDITMFDTKFFKLGRTESEMMDPQQKLLLETTWEALEDALINPQQLIGSPTGVFIGMASADFRVLVNNKLTNEDFNTYYASGCSLSIASGRISFYLGLQGPNFPIDTACSSSLVAVDRACKSLHYGESDLALAGGVNIILTPDISIGITKANMLSPDGRCKTFDASANGYVRSEGVGMVVLKRLSDAVRDGDLIYATILGSGVNQDGSSSGLTVPNGTAQEELLQTVLAQSGLKPDDIGYFETHGTGTSLGDPIEVRAISAIYNNRKSDNPLYLGAVKSNTGHLETAAGICGLIKVALSIQNKIIPENLHFNEINPHILLSEFNGKIPTNNIDWVSKNGYYAALSSFGFSGTNAHAILGEFVADQVIETEKPKVERLELFTISALDKAALNDQIGQHATFFENNKSLNLADTCYSSAVGRAQFKYRVAVLAKDNHQLVNRLNSLKEGSNVIAALIGRIKTSNEMMFYYSGQHNPTSESIKYLYDNVKLFKELFIQAINQAYDVSVENLHNKSYDKNCDFMSNEEQLLLSAYATTQLLVRWGIRPNYVSGERRYSIIAGCIAEIFDLATAVKLFNATKSQFCKILDEVELGNPSIELVWNDRTNEIPTKNNWLKIIEQPIKKSKTVEGIDLIYKLSSIPDKTGPSSLWKHLLLIVADNYVHGIDIDWLAFYQDHQCTKVRLPHYPFQRIRCWPDWL